MPVAGKDAARWTQGEQTQMDRIIRMVMNQIIRQLVNRGMSAGINRATRGSRREEDMTPEQRADLRQSQQRNRQLGRVARRIGRF